MPTIPDKCEFDIEATKVNFETTTNGDDIRIEGIHLDREVAATLAWLVNTDNHLTVEIKIKT